MSEGRLPKELRAETVQTQSYLRNCFPHRSLKGKAPLNVLTGRSFSVRHLKVIGSSSYVFIPRRHMDKLDNKAKKGVLVSYAQRTKGYKIWFPNTKVVVETKHVKCMNCVWVQSLKMNQKRTL